MTATRDNPTATGSRVREYYRTVDRQPREVHHFFTGDSIYRRPGYPALDGREALRDFYENQRTIRSGKHTLETLLAVDLQVAVRGIFQGVLHDGSMVETRFADFFILRPMHDSGYLISSRWTYFDGPFV